MGNVICHSRLALANRLQDRFLTCQVQKPQDPLQAAMGNLYFIIEITKPWFPNAQIGQSIINTLTREYFKSGSSSDLINFENGIRRVNEMLARLTERGETDWIGNLSAILALSVENEFHLSKVGRAEAYLVRRGKISHITEGLKDSTEPHPLKTFGNIISGTLQPSDNVILASPVLFDYLSIEDIRQNLDAKHPHESAKEISRILKKERVRQANALILELLPDEQLATIPGQICAQTIYLDQSAENLFIRTVKFFKEKFKPAAVRTGGFISSQASKGQAWFKTKALPGARDFSQKAKPIVRTSGSKIIGGFSKLGQKISFWRKKEPSVSPLPIQEPEKKPAQEAKIENFDLIGKTLYSVHDYSQIQSTKTNVFSKVWLAARKIFFKSGTALMTFFQWLFEKRNRRYLYIFIACLLILILGINLSFASKRQSARRADKNNVAKLQEAKADFEKGKQLVLFNDTTQARQVLAGALVKANEAKKGPTVGKEATDLIREIAKNLDKINSATRFEKLEPLVKFDNIAQHLILNEGNILTVDALGTKVLRASLLNGQVETLDNFPSGAGKVLDVILGPENMPLFYTSSQKIFQLKSPTNTLAEVQPKEAGWQAGISLATFANNLYILDPASNQIWKFTKADDGYAKASAFITDRKVDIKAGLDFTIDGAVYVFDRSGAVTKLSKGSKQDFALKEIPAPGETIKKPVAIYTDSEINSIYILDADAKRIVEVDKNGKYLHQYFLPDDFSSIKDFFVSPKLKKIWLLQGNGVYEIGIE